MINLSNKLKISGNHEPIIIAEISGNHGGSKKRFLQLIKSACLNGADLIKIQTYEPEDITLNKNYGKFKIKKGIWKGQKLWDMYQKACTPFAWHKDAFGIAKKYKKIIFSSPFSLRGVDLLEKLGCKIYKIASFEITDHKLIKYIASKKKPIIMSTGMATHREIFEAIKIIEKYHSNIILLHCVSSYPTRLEDINLNRIDELKKRYPKYLIGVSDHTKDIYSSVAATVKGVVVIEKHYKLNEKTISADSSFSISAKQLKELKLVTKNIFRSTKRNSSKPEKISINLRRAIFAKKDIKKGEKLTCLNIESLRPNIGICASNYFKIIGKLTKRNLKIGAPIFKKDLL